MRLPILPITVGFLAILALFLGYLIWQQNSPAPQPSEEDSPSLSEEEQILLTPGPDATEEERREHFELALRLARSAEVLDLTECSLADPVVLKVQEGETLIVKNDDESQHSMVFDQDTIYQIPAKGEIEITANFENGPGLYGYGCDQVPRAVGMILVEP